MTMEPTGNALQLGELKLVAAFADAIEQGG